jgi:metallo-beta-lactamase class B
MKRFALAALILACSGAQAAPDPFAQTRLEWNKPQKPFHVIGNIYYVGAAGVSAFLITTPQGHIVTDGALPESAPLIEANIKALGFKLSDVKILLNSHAHFDHSGSLARLKQVSGASLVASAADKPILESGHISFGPAANADSIPVKVDQVVADGGTVSLGGVTLTANVTSGHTPGCTTWTMNLRDGNVTRKVMFFCSISVAGNPLVGNKQFPGIVQAYRASFARLKTMQADIFLAPHGAQFRMEEKLAKVKPGAANPFIDPGELPRFIVKAEKGFDAELARQQAGAPPKL